MPSRLLLVCLFFVFAAAPAKANIVFPMTIWGHLQLDHVAVPAGARVQFLGSDGTSLGELTTEIDGQYGGTSVYDTNIALSAFQETVHMKVIVGEDAYDVIVEHIDDTQRDDGCPAKDAITFVSQSCRYNIAISVPACTQDDWEYGAWSACQGGTQTRTAQKTMRCTGEPPAEVTRSCEQPAEERPRATGGSSGGGTAYGSDPNARKQARTQPVEELPPTLVMTGGDDSAGSGETTAAPLAESAVTVEPAFRDIAGHWSEGYIHALTKTGVLKNQAWFRPDEAVNRAEFLKSIVEALNISAVPADVPFHDVPRDAWYTSYVHTAYALGIITGYPDGSFRAAQPINRAEGVKMLLSAAGVHDARGFVPFDDVPADAWFAGYVGYAFEHGLVRGTSDTHFAPEAKLTRAQMAKIIHLFLSLSPASS